LVKSRNSIGRDCSSVNRKLAMGSASCHCFVLFAAHPTKKKAGYTAWLRVARAETQGLIRPRPDDAIDFFGKRYSYLRQFVPLLLHTLTLRAQGPDETVLRAVEVIRDLDRVPTRRPVPKNAPLALVTDA